MSPHAPRSVPAWSWDAGGRRVEASTAEGIDCARPLRFDPPEPAPWGAPPPRRTPLDLADGPADVRQGATVNADRLDLVPHAHGTHTETFGHLSAGRESLVDVFVPRILPASVVTVAAETGPDAALEAGPAWAPGDRVITAAAMARALEACDPSFLDGLAVRVAPDAPAGASTYFTGAAAGLLRDRGVLHLVLELPSIDRPSDGGRLSAHRAFWGMGDASRDPDATRRDCTLTEMADFPPELVDGSYLLDLHVPRMDTDAAPSRPVLYPVRAVRAT